MPIYAVRLGRHGLANAIFLNWDDAQRFIIGVEQGEGDDDGDHAGSRTSTTAVFASFQSMNEAVAYLEQEHASHRQPPQPRPPQQEVSPARKVMVATRNRKRSRDPSGSHVDGDDDDSDENTNNDDNTNDHHNGSDDPDTEDDEEDDEIPIAVLAAKNHKQSRGQPPNKKQKPILLLDNRSCAIATSPPKKKVPRKPSELWNRLFQQLEAFHNCWKRMPEKKDVLVDDKDVPGDGKKETTTNDNNDATTTNDIDNNNSNSSSSSNTNTSEHHSMPAITAELWEWMLQQRWQYRKLQQGAARSTLTEYKIDALNQIGFDFRYKSWQDRYEQLKLLVQQFMEQYGPPHASTRKGPGRPRRNNINAATIEAQRQQALLTHLEQVLVLPQLHNSNNTNSSQGKINNKDKDKHKNVPLNDRSNDKSDDASKNNKLSNQELLELGNWFVKQREQCGLLLQGKSCKHLSKEQLELLFALKVVDPTCASLGRRGATTSYSATATANSAAQNGLRQTLSTIKQNEREQEWEACFEEFLHYKKEHGSGLIPTCRNKQQHVNDPQETNPTTTPISPALTKWAGNTKNQYWRLRHKPDLATSPSWLLTAARIQRLQDAGFVFSQTQRPKYIKFEDWKERLEEFKDKHGHTRVPHDFPEDQALSNWVHKCRNEYRKFWENKEEEEQKQDDAGASNYGKTDGVESNKADAIAEKKYRNKYAKKSALTLEQINELEEMGFLWQLSKRVKPTFAADRKTWDERFEELIEFKKENGHTMVPQAYPKLGEWVKRQRKNYKLMKAGRKCKTPMTAEQAFKLQEIGFVFDVRQQQQRQALEHQGQQVQLQRQQQNHQHRQQQQQQIRKENAAHSGNGGRYSPGPPPQQHQPQQLQPNNLHHPASILHHQVHEQQHSHPYHQIHPLGGQIPAQNPLLSLQPLQGQQPHQPFGWLL